MSVAMSQDLARQTQSALITDQELLATLRESLPYAWALVCYLAAQLKATGATFADDQSGPPSKVARSQLLALAADDQLRAVIERRFGVKLGFRNRYHLALFDPAAVADYHHFTGTRARPEHPRPITA